MHMQSANRGRVMRVVGAAGWRAAVVCYAALMACRHRNGIISGSYGCATAETWLQLTPARDKSSRAERLLSLLQLQELALT
jgi:hypothetical protein